MSEWFAVVRMQNGRWVPIKSEDDDLATWPSLAEAEKALENHILAPLGFFYFELP